MAILYSFRRCPYAIRARFALIYAAIPFDLREVKLSDKPKEMLSLSPKGTVPVLQLDNGRVIDESVDIVEYALSRNDPQKYALESNKEEERVSWWLNDWQPRWMQAILHYKYHDRYPELNKKDSWEILKSLLEELNESLEKNNGYALRCSFSMLDILLLPLIRQFAIIDLRFFKSQNWPYMHQWLDKWMSSDIYHAIMLKQDPWKSQERS